MRVIVRFVLIDSWRDLSDNFIVGEIKTFFLRGGFYGREIRWDGSCS